MVKTAPKWKCPECGSEVLIDHANKKITYNTTPGKMCRICIDYIKNIKSE